MSSELRTMLHYSSRMHRIYLILGTLLLVSSMFIAPISASASTRNLPQPVVLARTGQIFIPGVKPPFSLEKTDSQAGPLIVSGNALNDISQPSVPSMVGSYSSTASGPGAFLAPGGDGIVRADMEMPPPIMTLGILTGSISNLFWGSSGSSEITVQAQGGAILAAQPYTSGAPQNFLVKTAGEFVTANFIDSASGPGSGQVIISVQSFGNFYNPSVQSYSSTLSLTSVTSAIPGLWLDSSKRRSRSQIYVEILELMKRGPMTPFEIAFYGRLNHKRTKEYAEFLKRSGYLEAIVEDERLTYVLTKNGMAFLERVKMLFEEKRPTEYVNYYSSS